MKTLTTLLILLVGMLFISAPMNQVSAAEVCENPGPYGICIPDTAISIGGIVLQDQDLVALVAVYGLGIVLLLNSNLIRTKILTKFEAK